MVIIGGCGQLLAAGNRCRRIISLTSFHKAERQAARLWGPKVFLFQSIKTGLLDTADAILVAREEVRRARCSS